MIKNFCRIAFIFSLASTAKAAEAQSTSKQLPQITVTAPRQSAHVNDGYVTKSSRSSTRTETPLLNTPQAVSVVTEEQIRDQNVTSMEEALRYAPGVNIQQGENNRDQVTIRGNSTSADFFVDGARDDVQYFRDFYNTESIEFLRGPNAMAFGRGGSGGVINRVSKLADGEKKRQLLLSGGSFDNRRIQADLGDKVNKKIALRFNTMYERSNSYRQYVNLERYGFAPTATIVLGKNTDLKLGYEYFSDSRVNDRGLPSQNGMVYVTKPSTFVGNPNENTSDAKVNSGFITFNHDFSSKLQLRNHTRLSKASKFYQNVYANSPVDSAGNFNLAAYNDTYDRQTFTNQTDFTKKFGTGGTKHAALFGAEITRQNSDNVRKTGFFNGSTTSQTLSIANPISTSFMDYRNTATVNNNSADVNVYGIYLQDQIDLNKYVQLTGGLRHDRFEVSLRNYNTTQVFKRSDNLISPRAGIVLEPKDSLSFYGSYSVGYLPSAGDQFNSLDAQVKALKPEKLDNYEIGSKWDITPKLNFTTAFYRLDRTNTRANDPNNSGSLIATGASRTNGAEFALTGKITDQWQIVGGYAYQDAFIVSKSSTSGSEAGRKIALVPHNRTSLWNKYDFTPKLGAAVGIIRQSDQFASVDNTTRLKGFTRFDGAIYYQISQSYRLQVNVENIFDHGYVLTAHNNNNIQPGSPRAFKAVVKADF